jgi:hypothetical protein
MGKLYVLPLITHFYFPVDFFYRYSNTLLMTFNNRIALRKMTSVHQGTSENSRGSDRMPIRQPMNLNSEVSTFRVAADGFGKTSAGQESYEIDVSVRLDDGHVGTHCCYMIPRL